MRLLLLLLVALLLSSCSAKKLSEQECKDILAKEIEVAADNAMKSSNPLEAMLAPTKYGGPDACFAGKSYTRADYTCVTQAQTKDQLRTCLDAAHAHIAPDR